MTDQIPVFLGGALGTTTILWREFESPGRRVVRFDLRGHGQSPAATSGVEITHLASDVIGLADQLQIPRFHYVGISLGGAVGQVLGHDYEVRLQSLTLASTAMKFGEQQDWVDRAELARTQGMGPIADANEPRWFGDDVAVERREEILAALRANDTESYAHVCEAIGRYDARPWASEIHVPTLVIGGADDPAVPGTRALAETIPGASYVEIAGARHLANVCRPAEFNAAVAAHLDR